jgi:hypothetical protein
MGDERRERPIPAGLKAAMIALALGWIVLLLVLSRTHTARQRQRPQAVLPVYPSAVDLSKSSVPDRDWRTVAYSVALDYPSLDVFHYYDERMTDQGWSREGAPELPEWEVSRDEGRRQASLLAGWFSPDRLMQLDLQLRWEEPAGAKREADEEYHMRVTATMQRSAAPFIELPRKRQTPPDKGESPFAK